MLRALTIASLLTLILFPVAVSGQTTHTASEETAVQEVVRGFTAATGRKDTAQALALCVQGGSNPAALPALVRRLSNVPWPAADSLRLKKTQFRGDTARVRASGQPVPPRARQADEAMHFGEVVYYLRREAGQWRILTAILAEVDLADRLERLSEPAARQRVLEEEREIVSEWLAVLLRTRASSRRRLNQVEGSLAASRAGEQVAEFIGDHALKANLVVMQADALTMAGRFSEAEEVVDRGIRLAEQATNPLTISYGLSVKAGMLRRQDEHMSAIELYRKSIEVAEAAKLYNLAASAYRNLGGCLKDMGNLAGALRELVKARDAAEVSGDKDQIAAAYNNTAALYMQMEELALSKEFALKALGVYEELKDRTGVVLSWGNLAGIYRRQQRLDEALEQYQQVLTVFEKEQPDPARAALTLRSIGMVHEAKKDLDQAQAYYEKALAGFEQTRQSRYLSAVLIDLARIQERRGDHKAALTLAERAIQIDQRIGDPIATFVALKAKADAQRSLNQKREALSTYGEAVLSLETGLGGAATSETQSERFFEHQVSAYVSAAEILLESGDVAGALSWAERGKARTLVDILPAGHGEVERGMTPEERAEEKRLSRAIADLNTRRIRTQPVQLARDAAADATTEELRKTRLRYVEFETRLYAAHPELRVHRGKATPVTVEEAARKLLTPDSAILTYLVGAESTHLLVLTKPAGSNSEPVLKSYRLPITRSKLAERCDRLVALLEDPNKPLKREATELYDLALRPAEAQIRGKRLLYVSPDGPLWRVPLQALITPAGRYVVEDRAVAYVPSITALREMAAKRAKRHAAAASQKGLFALGDPAVNGERLAAVYASRTELRPLPEAAQEVRELQRLYAASGAVAYLGKEATEDRFKKECGRYRIVHLASHGLLDDKNPMYSKVVLADPAPGAAQATGEDGLLEAWEMMDLDLSADLVVLAACETGRGRIGAGEGVIGMAWALFIAGCPSTVVSQWEVRSDSTRQLMLAFHRSLNAGWGKGAQGPVKAAALRLAALTLLKRPEYRHPFHWAGFSLIGDAE